MNYLIFLITISVSFSGKWPQINEKEFNQSQGKQDSTLQQRFIVSLLSEYDQEGRWIFAKIERCKFKIGYEIIQPGSIYRMLSERTSTIDKKLFIWTATQNLSSNSPFYGCLERTKVFYPNATYEIEGKKINMRRYSKLKKMPINKLLKNYFDINRQLFSKHKNVLNELIAVCYENNIKVITTNTGTATYYLFE